MRSQEDHEQDAVKENERCIKSGNRTGRVKKNEFRILVAEDDEMVRDVIVRFLSEEKYPVVVADNGLAAIKLLRLEDIKLVLADLRMPGADGMEVLRTALRIDPDIAVVLLTAYGTLDTALEAMKEGAYDYIVKPFVMQQLLLVVRNAFRMANLLEENRQLSACLKETYRALEAIKARGGCQHGTLSRDSIDKIEKSREPDIIDAEDSAVLDRMTSGSTDENIKKYSSLINDLKTGE